jgi:uncharacterized protein (TIGR02145 family)
MRKETLIYLFFITVFASCKKDETTLPKLQPAELLSGKAGSGTGNGSKFGTMKDIDGNTYKTVTIGKQIWMAENLRVTKYRNGNPIQLVEDKTVWANSNSGAWCNYGNTSADGLTFGNLYNWFAVNDPRGLAPKGWHIPTSAEVDSLVKFLGGVNEAGGAMKETSLTYWATPNEGASNNSSFSARAAGIREFNGDFTQRNLTAAFWTSEMNNSYNANDFYLVYNSKVSYQAAYYMTAGFSVRCIKD